MCEHASALSITIRHLGHLPNLLSASETNVKNKSTLFSHLEESRPSNRSLETTLSPIASLHDMPCSCGAPSHEAQCSKPHPSHLRLPQHCVLGTVRYSIWHLIDSVGTGHMRQPLHGILAKRVSSSVTRLCSCSGSGTSSRMSSCASCLQHFLPSELRAKQFRGGRRRGFKASKGSSSSQP